MINVGNDFVFLSVLRELALFLFSICDLPIDPRNRTQFMRKAYCFFRIQKQD